MKALIIDKINNLDFNALRDKVSRGEINTLSFFSDSASNCAAIIEANRISVSTNIRCTLCKDSVENAARLGCQSITLVDDQAHRLEYSFGVDVLKFKPLLRELAELCHSYNIRCGVATDFRHENILHAQDCGADFVEVDFAKYNEHKEHYDLAIEIAHERELDIVKKSDSNLVIIK